MAKFFVLVMALNIVWVNSLPSKLLQDAKVLGHSESVLVISTEQSPNILTAAGEIVLEHSSLHETAANLDWFAEFPKTFTIIISESVRDPEEVFNAAPARLRENSLWLLPGDIQIESLAELRLDSKVLLYSVDAAKSKSFQIRAIYRVKNARPTRVVEPGIWSPEDGFDFQINSAHWWALRSDLRGFNIIYSALDWPPMVSVKR